jgi:fructose-1-phosphate kinase PfkB-like protein
MMTNTEEKLLADSPAAQNQQQEETVKLVVNPRQFNVIVAGLAELPYKVSNEVLQALVAQVQQQVKTAPQ